MFVVRSVLAFLVLAYSAVAQFACTGGSVYVIAHPDDDLLFQAPTLQNELAANKCFTTVTLTAGDAGAGLSYASSREVGNMAAYAQMLGVNSSYTDTYQTLGGQRVLVRTLTAVPTVQKVHFRLPDGALDANGYTTTQYESLRRLYFGDIGTITAIDGTATYTLGALQGAINQILTSRKPVNVRTLDHLSDYDGGDHPDHLTTARITASLAAGTTNFAGYMGYPVQNLPATLSTNSAAYKAKTDAFFAYTPYDYMVCQDLNSCNSQGYGSWLQRQYAVTPALATKSSNGFAQNPAVLPPGSNIALQAVAKASSQSGSAQAPSKAIDNVIGGYPGDSSVEWSSNGEGNGAWITLTWNQSVSIWAVVLYDRPNTYDRVMGGFLTFDDGVENIGSLYQDGSATVFNLAKNHTTKSITMTITSVSSTTQNVGLSEFQVYGAFGSNVPPVSNTTGSTNTTAPPPPLILQSSDLALLGYAEASSEAWYNGQTADKAIDGISDGYPGNYSAEWATDGQGAGAWWKLSWPEQIVLNQVVLYDRPNLNDQITSGLITFSDGTALNVTTLDNAGGANVYNFTVKTINSLLFQVTGVSSTTQNVGLAEFQAYYLTSPTANATTVTNTTISNTTNTNVTVTNTTITNTTETGSITTALPTVLPTFNSTAAPNATQTMTGNVTTTFFNATVTPAPTSSGRNATTTFIGNATITAGPTSTNNASSSTSMSGSTSPSANVTSMSLSSSVSANASRTSSMSASATSISASPTGSNSSISVSRSSTSASGAASTTSGSASVSMAVSSSSLSSSSAPANSSTSTTARSSSSSVSSVGQASVSVSTSGSSSASALSTGQSSTSSAAPSALSTSRSISGSSSSAPTSAPATTSSPASSSVSRTSSTAPSSSAAPPPPPPPPPTPPLSTNYARQGTASASSFNVGQGPSKAIDGIISGWPDNSSAEWASNGEGVGALWKVSWLLPVSINQVWLYDRPNTNDWITGASLVFSDGSSVPVPALNNAGQATVVRFPTKFTSSLVVRITSVGPETRNVGLSEVQAYNA